MGMIQKLLGAVIILAVFTAERAFGHETEASLTQCHKAMTLAAIALVQDEFLRPEAASVYGKPLLDANVAAHNDIVCDGHELMANVVIIVEPNPGEAFYGIFHIHFSENGFLRSAASIEPKWRMLGNKEEWKAGWCDFLKTSLESYKEELERHGCE